MIRIGIIGNGGIANSHMDGYLQLGDRVKVTACADINIDKAKEFAERYDIPNYYGSCEEMLAAEELDAVSVTTWNSAHAPCTIAALNAGCHVLCEKPMAMNAAEAQAMKDAADKNGKLLMLGFVRRHGDDAKLALDLVKNGDLGEVYYAQATYLRRCGFPGGWFGDRSRSGGGPLIDLGVHVIDLARYVMGKPKAVSAYGVTFDKLGSRPGLKGSDWESQTEAEEVIFNVEDLAAAFINFENGATLRLEASFNLNMPENRNELNIYGSKSGITLEPFGIYGERDGRLSDEKLHGSTSFDFRRDFRREVKNFVDCLEGTAECIAPAEDGVELMRILDAVYQSAAEKRSIDIKR